MRKLRIGISSCFFHADPLRPIFKGKTLLYIEQSLAHWVMEEDVLAYAIPDWPDTSAYADDLDGLILHGGADVSPKSYGEEPLKPEWQGDYIRDQYEIRLFNEFRKRKKPILGICRGAQLINVACGGTLIQDIPSQTPTPITHRNWDIYDQNFHEISFDPQSELKKIYPGKNTVKVNSIHHQGLKKLGKDLVVDAWSEPDHMIEAIRSTADSFVYAVQWHPEFHDQNNPTVMDSTPLLKRFLEEARKCLK